MKNQLTLMVSVIATCCLTVLAISPEHDRGAAGQQEQMRPPIDQAGAPNATRPMAPDGNRPPPNMVPPRQGQMGGRPPMQSPESILRAAGTSEEKIQQCSELVYAAALAKIDVQATIDRAERTLRHLMRAEGTDREKILKAVKGLNEARSIAFEADIKLQLDLQDLLGKELAARIAPRHERGSQGPRGGMGPVPPRPPMGGPQGQFGQMPPPPPQGLMGGQAPGPR